MTTTDRFASSAAYAERTSAFKAHIDAGGMVEATDWMPDEYRESALKFIEMHANSEIMGALPEREWIPRAPSLRRKMSLTAKVQDEVGHGHMLYRVAEDLGKSRDAMIADLIAGRTKFQDRKSTRLNSSHANISYAVFCLKKKKKQLLSP